MKGVPRRHHVPVLLVSGVNETAMLAATISLQFGLPGAVAVRHVIDADRQLLTRTVSDVSGVVENEEINLAHACVACAIREDIVPTLERLANEGRWSNIVACLPVAAEAIQVCRVLAWTPGNAPHVSIAAVVTALDGVTVTDDLLGDDLLNERGLHTGEDDDRGVAEVACAMVEYADLVCLTDSPAAQGRALLAVLARPNTPVITDPSVIDAAQLATGVHRHQSVEAWVADVRSGVLPPLDARAGASGIWRLDLRSERPFHPSRLYDEVSALGGGPRRSRGCFWLPTRPDNVCAWDGAGGQVSIGSTQQWAQRQHPLTRIVVVGTDDRSADVTSAFERILLTEQELAIQGERWNDDWDGLEPWLGPINHVA